MVSQFIVKSRLIAIAASRGPQRKPLNLSRGSGFSSFMHRIELFFNTFPQKEPFTVVTWYHISYQNHDLSPLQHSKDDSAHLST
jgi:hypothetical protein